MCFSPYRAVTFFDSRNNSKPMHHHIKPRSQLTRDEVRADAIAAADRGDDLAEANQFEPGTPNHTHFRSEYLKREYALSTTA